MMSRQFPVNLPSLARQFDLDMADEIYAYKPARLQEREGSTDEEKLKREWYVVYYVYSSDSKKLVRRRVTIDGPTISGRRKEAAQVIREVNDLLKKGAYVGEREIKVEAKVSVSAELNSKTLVVDALAHFLRVKRATLKRQSVGTYEKNARQLTEYLTEKKLLAMSVAKFTESQAFGFSEWLTIERKLAPKTHNGYRGFASSLFQYLVKRKVLVTNPFGEVPTLNAPAGQHLPFTSGQMAEFKQACVHERGDLMLWLHCAFIYYTYLRPHEELRFLRIGDLLDHTVRVRPQQAKTSEVRYVKMAEGLKKLIEEYNLRKYPPHFYVFSNDDVPGTKQVGSNFFYYRHVRILKAIGLYGHGYDLYGWKHSGICALYRATRDIKLIQRQCGHSRIEQTDQYLRELGLYAEDEDVLRYPEI